MVPRRPNMDRPLLGFVKSGNDSAEHIRDTTRALTQRALDPQNSVACLPLQDLIRAAIDGRLSRGFGVKRLMDLRMNRPQP